MIWVILGISIALGVLEIAIILSLFMRRQDPSSSEYVEPRR